MVLSTLEEKRTSPKTSLFLLFLLFSFFLIHFGNAMNDCFECKMR